DWVFGDFQSLKPNPDEHRIQPIGASHLEVIPTMEADMRFPTSASSGATATTPRNPSRDPDEYPVPDHESHVPQEFPEEIPMEQPNEEPLSPIPEP
ncbi:hypothetical protein KUU39_23930, partial [Pseudomonas aeruginosa]|nr:hypothetical protein [Pseudomonas aeruginosa]